MIQKQKYHGIHFPAEEIARFCQRNRIERLSFYGSVLRDDFRPDSDIDILVEFEPAFPRASRARSGATLCHDVMNSYSENRVVESESLLEYPKVSRSSERRDTGHGGLLLESVETPVCGSYL